MRKDTKTLIKINNLSLTLGDKTIFNNISKSIIVNDKVGLIGLNGSGKTTLLKLIEGSDKSLKDKITGDINRTCTPTYVQQIDLGLYRKNIKIYEYISQSFPDWWLVLERYEQIFNDHLLPDKSLNICSGGELLKLDVAIALAQKPQLLILDEPTNHLDLRSISQLTNILNNEIPTFIVVSHNIDFLNRTVEKIWELDNGGVQEYGGNYDFYKEQKDILKRKTLLEINSLNKQITKITNTALRKQSEANSLDQKVTSRNPYSKKLIGKKARTAKILKSKTEQRITALKAKKQSLLVSSSYLNIKSNSCSGLVFSLQNGSLILPDNTPLISDINLTIHHKDRISISGDNGTGKTTLVKQFGYNQNSLIKGNLKYGAKYSTLFQDQKYDLVNPQLSVLQNMETNNPHISYEEIRQFLGDIGFKTSYDINKKASLLSGGEIARLAISIAVSNQVDLLILDEPTNNIDIPTIEIIKQALNRYKGTLVVISHDIVFLEAINIKRRFEIDKKQFLEIIVKDSDQKPS